MAMGGISDESIKERAYHIWIREGCPHGRDFEHWVQAQVELEVEQHTGNGVARGAKAATPRAKAPKVAKPASAKPARKTARKPAARAKKKP